MGPLLAAMLLVASVASPALGQERRAGNLYDAAGQVITPATPLPASPHPTTEPVREGILVLAWSPRASMPTARGQHTAVRGNDGLIYAAGGFAGGAEMLTLEVFNPVTDTWTTKASTARATRGAAGAVGSDGTIYVIGGFSGFYVDAMQAYSPSTDTWATRAPLPIPVWQAAAATGSDGRIYVFGGEQDPFPRATPAVQIYNPSTNTWSSGAPMPQGRFGHAAVRGQDGKIYVIGGMAADQATATKDVQIYDPIANSWTTGALMPTARFEMGAALTTGGRIVVAGGSTSYSNNTAPYLNNVEVYDPALNTWVSETSLPTGRRELACPSDAGGTVYCIGGTNGIYQGTNEATAPAVPPAPTISVQLVGCTTCMPGNRFTAQATVENQTGLSVRVEVKLGFVDPNGDELAFSILGDRHFEFVIPPGVVGPVTVLDVPLPTGLQPGIWSLEGALLEPELGKTLSRQFKEFTVAP